MSNLDAQIVYVDSTVPSGGVGTEFSPYRSLTYALSLRSMITGPAEYRVAGNGPAAPYTYVGLGIQENEIFPIVIPNETLISYWDVDDLLPSRPPSAIFRPTPVGGIPGGTGFRISSPDLTNGVIVGISGYVPAFPLTLPDTNQGFELRGFQDAVEISDGANVSIIDATIAGVSYFECEQAVVVSITASSGSSVSMVRNLLRAPDTLFSPTLPLVDVLFRHPGAGTSSFSFTMARSDLRPGDIDMASSMMAFRGELCNGRNDFFNITLRNVKITGQSPTNPIGGPPAPRFIDGAGIEVGLKDACQGMVTLENVSVRDANSEGLA